MVDLPAPLSPTITSTEPALARSDTPCRGPTTWTEGLSRYVPRTLRGAGSGEGGARPLDETDGPAFDALGPPRIAAAAEGRRPRTSANGLLALSAEQPLYGRLALLTGSTSIGVEALRLCPVLLDVDDELGDVGRGVEPALVQGRGDPAVLDRLQGRGLGVDGEHLDVAGLLAAFAERRGNRARRGALDDPEIVHRRIGADHGAELLRRDAGVAVVAFPDQFLDVRVLLLDLRPEALDLGQLVGRGLVGAEDGDLGGAAGLLVDEIGGDAAVLLVAGADREGGVRVDAADRGDDDALGLRLVDDALERGRVERAGDDAVGAVGDRLLDLADHRRDVDLVRPDQRRLVAAGRGAILEDLARAAPVGRLGQRVHVPDVERLIRRPGHGRRAGEDRRPEQAHRRKRKREVTVPYHSYLPMRALPGRTAKSSFAVPISHPQTAGSFAKG